MSLFEDVMSLAVQLPQPERERLAEALGVRSATPRLSLGTSLPLASLAARPDPVAWRKAETGHAVLNTGAADESQEDGPSAIEGMWRQHAAELLSGSTPEANGAVARASQLPPGTPVVVHTDVCTRLACGEEDAVRFFQAAAVEVRLATATYLSLLGAAENEGQQARIRRFVRPYAVLSLGPMASSRSAELMFDHALQSGLTPLDALIAATALAHEIPLVTADPRPLTGIEELTVCLPQ